MYKLIDANPDDSTFLYELFASAKLEEMAGANRPTAQQEDFVRMQHKAQQQYYSRQYPQASNQIVVCDGQRAGRILTAHTGADISVVDIMLLSAFRNRGVGTALLRALQESAKAEGLGLCLHVLLNNPARRLYSRLGFHDDGILTPYIRMRWQA